MHDLAGDREAIALDAVRRLVGEHRRMPPQGTWPAAGMIPSDRTARKMFGSVRAAVEAAGALALIAVDPTSGQFLPTGSELSTGPLVQRRPLIQERLVCRPSPI